LNAMKVSRLAWMFPVLLLCSADAQQSSAPIAKGAFDDLIPTNATTKRVSTAPDFATLKPVSALPDFATLKPISAPKPKLLTDDEFGISSQKTAPKILTDEEFGVTPPKPTNELSDAEVFGQPKELSDSDVGIGITPAIVASQQLQPLQRRLQSASEDDTAWQLRMDELNRESERLIEQQREELAQERQQQALEDIASQLRELRYQQEDEAMQQSLISPPPISVSPSVVVSPNSFDPDSLANPYGAGSPYKSDGLMNPYSQYGSPYSSKSWRNPYATDTPKLYDSQGNYRGKLSSNPYDPDSTANPYGRYGSPYSPDSINNPYGAGNPYDATPIYVVPSP